MEMNIQTTKIELIQWLNSLSDSAMIQKVLDLRNSSYNGVAETTVEEKEAIQYGITDADKRNVSAHSEARKIYEKWL